MDILTGFPGVHRVPGHAHRVKGKPISCEPLLSCRLTCHAIEYFQHVLLTPPLETKFIEADAQGFFNPRERIERRERKGSARWCVREGFGGNLSQSVGRNSADPFVFACEK